MDCRQINQAPHFELPQARLGRNWGHKDIASPIPLGLRVQHFGVEQLEAPDPRRVGLLLFARPVGESLPAGRVQVARNECGPRTRVYLLCRLGPGTG